MLLHHAGLAHGGFWVQWQGILPTTMEKSHQRKTDKILYVFAMCGTGLTGNTNIFYTS
jgi:hypothetical protein